MPFKGKYWVIILLVSIFTWWSTPVASGLEKGSKYTTHFTREDHGQHPQNWAVLQDERGVIYVGNNGGILEYDGKSWRTIVIPSHTVRSLAKYHDGTIYAGGVNEIGFLAHTTTGGLEYRSLTPRVKESQRNFSNVRRTLVTKEGVYFRGEKFLFRWTPETEKLRAWEAEYGFDSSFVCFGKLYIRDGRKGLLYMEGGSLHPAPGGDIFAKEEIFVMAPHDNGYLVITRNLGCFIYNGTTFFPFPTQRDDFLKEKKVYHGIRLSDQNYALATLRGGLVIMDKKGNELHVLDKNHDLPENDVKFVFEDTWGNLWLGLDFGILRIEYTSPFSIYDSRFNLPNVVLSVQRHRENLYIGSSNGLFVLPEGQKKFRPAAGIKENCWSLLSTGDALAAATSGAVFLLEGKKITEILKKPAYTLLRSSQDPNRIWVGTLNGLASIYRKEGRWEKEWEEETMGREIRTLAEDNKGGLWLGPKSGGVLKITGAPGANFQAENFNEKHGLPKGETRLFKAAGHVIFAGLDGILRFDGAAGEFIPDNTLGEAFTQPDSMVFKIAEDKRKHIWLHARSRNYRGTPTPGGKIAIDSTPFLRMPQVQVNVIYPEGNRVWFGTNEDLVCFETTGKKDYRREFNALLRRVVVNGKRVIYKGHGGDGGKQSPAEIPVLEYKDRNLFFEFAAPFFESETATKFRWLMKGYDKDWSSWSNRAEIVYTNLNPGRYTFMVQGQNIYGHQSSIFNFDLRILPPWYLTFWAIAVYIAILFMLMFLAVKWRSHKLQLEKQRLEKVIEERTTEINRKNRQLEQQTHQLKEQSEQLQEMDRLKAGFFANISHEFRTPLTLIMGSLEQMSGGGPDEQGEHLDLMRHHSQRLLSLINQLLDLAKLDSGKMKLQAVRQDLVPLMNNVLTTFQIAAKQKRLELKARFDEDSAEFYFDEEKIEECICNLLQNAIKFTPPGGKITVSIKLGLEQDTSFPQGYVEISIRDTGIGIPREKLDHIFDRFYQADDSGKGYQKGTGIGLALTRELVTLHHGKINVHSSEGNPRGTEFVIRLPLGDKLLEPGEKKENTAGALGHKCANKGLYLMDRDNLHHEPLPHTGEEKNTGQEDPETTGEPGEPDKEVILVVEDETDVRRLIRKTLEPYYTVVEAQDGRDGVEKAREQIPDLVISDIKMPRKDGYQLCRELKKDVKTSHIPVILLTAKVEAENVIEGLETGADDYVTKPFHSKILCARIKNLIELRRQLQQKMQRKLRLQPSEIPVSSLDEDFLKEVQAVIDANLSDPDFNVESFSKKLFMNRVTLYRKIRALTGETPTEFIRSFRLKRAVQLLKANAGNVTEVALNVGFSSSSYFARCFKKKFHHAPSDYPAAEILKPGSNE